MRLRVLLFLCLATLTGQQSSPSKPASEGQTNQQKARAIIDRMIVALGGQAYLTAQDAYTQGRYGRFHNDAMVATNVFYRYWRWPGSERNELAEVPDLGYLFLRATEHEFTFRS